LNVTIALALYNGAGFIRELLDSLVLQTKPVTEVIASDDGSTDKTLDILAEYAGRLPLTVIRNPGKKGATWNFENALRSCHGEYVALCDQDDIWEPGKVERLLQGIKHASLVHSDASVIDHQGAIVAPSFSRQIHKQTRTEFKKLLFRNSVTGCTSMFRRELLDRALPFPEGLPVHDWWLALVAEKTTGITYVPETLTRYRQHGGNLFGNNDARGGTVSQAWQVLTGNPDWISAKLRPDLRAPLYHCVLENIQRLGLTAEEQQECRRLQNLIAQTLVSSGHTKRSLRSSVRAAWEIFRYSCF